MLVTMLVPDGKTKSKIFLDGVYAGFLMNREVISENITEAMVISDEQWAKILESIIIPRGKKKALDLLLFQERSEKELEERLLQANYTASQVEVILSYVHQFTYLDDVRYALHYIEAVSARKSMRQIRYDLQTKGVSESDVTMAVEKFLEQKKEESSDLELVTTDERTLELIAIRSAVDKKFRNKTQYDEKDFTKLFGTLARKGFQIDNIKRVFEEMKREAEIEEGN